MKAYIFALLIAFALSHYYKSGVGEIRILKFFYAKSKDREEFIRQIFDSDIPKEVKIMVKNYNYISEDFKPNIDVNYNQTVGGYAKGEINYYYKYGGYNFIYAIAEADLKPLTSYLEPICRRPMPILPLKCIYIKSFPSYEKITFKKYVAERMRNELFVKKYVIDKKYLELLKKN